MPKDMENTGSSSTSNEYQNEATENSSETKTCLEIIIKMEGKKNIHYF